MNVSRPRTVALALAFATIYVVWGSTYLAIRVGVETIPPFLMLGARFLFAGVVLYGWLRFRGVTAPTARQWLVATVTGVMMLFLGTGMVGVAEQTLDSGLAALLVSTTPLWMVLAAWLGGKGERPRAAVFAGIAIGLLGVFLLFDPFAAGQAGWSAAVPGLLVVGASVSWAVASVYSKGADLPSNAFMTSAMQMTAGGAALLLGAAATGELAGFTIASVSGRSAWALAYLVVFGSFLAFSAYVWLLGVASPARVSTYAFVNPAVAVFLGWLLLGEPVTLRILLSMALLTLSVVVILRLGR